MHIQVELLLLIVSLLFFASIIVSKASSKLGVPVLLLFLAVGMVFGVDGFGIQFDSIRSAQMIGTVPIIFAILCRAENVPHADDIFNIVFVCTLISLILQGSTLSLVGKWLKVADDPEPEHLISNFDIEFQEEIKSATCEVEITEQVLEHGNRLMDYSIPENTLVIMVKRGSTYFVPTGKTQLLLGDKLMVISDNDEALVSSIRRIGAAMPGK